MLSYGVTGLELGKLIARSWMGQHVAKQLVRSATAAGANYEEARAAESRADFVHKLQLVLKELRESRYWLRLAAANRMLPARDVATPLDEADQLIRIFVKSLVTTRMKL
jgi:four helix bundle protein